MGYEPVDESEFSVETIDGFLWNFIFQKVLYGLFRLIK